MILLVGAALSSAFVVGIEERERRIEARYSALPTAQDGSLEGVEDRLVGLERLIDAHPFSRQGFHMSRERHRLRLELDELEAQSIEDRRSEEEVSTARLLEAESARVRGLELAGAEDLEGAYEHFKQSLEASPLAWDETERIKRDMEAIESFLEEQQ